MAEYIYEITKDSDGVDCYIKRWEIVRCADCKHWVTVIDRKKAEYGLCDVIKVVGTTPKDGFCYKGERREEI